MHGGQGMRGTQTPPTHPRAQAAKGSASPALLLPEGLQRCLQVGRIPLLEALIGHLQAEVEGLDFDPLFLHLLPQQGSQLGPMLGLRGPPLLQGCGVTLWREVSNYVKQVGGWAAFRTWLGGL